MTAIYCHARVAQRGHGFGNRLLPWARCRVFSRSTGTPMLATRWARLAVGPLIRGGASLPSFARQFLLLGLFRDLPGEIVGLRGRMILARGPRLEEPEALDRGLEGERRGVVTFEGWRDQFARLNGWEAQVLADLEEMTLPTLRSWVVRGAPVVLNVRASNDFPASVEGADRVEPGYRSPFSWFRETLERIREVTRPDLPALVVSDGSDLQLAPLLSLPFVRRAPNASAVTDLLTAASARVLVASGSSSFSAWAAFLGGMPAASVPGQPMDVWRIRRVNGAYLGEFDPRCPSPAFLRQAAEALGGVSGIDAREA